jgi:hypothetical protein
MKRRWIGILVVTTVVGCQSSSPAYDPFAGYGATRVPPPATGSIGRNGYAQPAGMVPVAPQNFPAVAPTAPTLREVPNLSPTTNPGVSYTPAAPAPQFAATNTSSTPGEDRLVWLTPAGTPSNAGSYPMNSLNAPPTSPYSQASYNQPALTAQTTTPLPAQVTPPGYTQQPGYAPPAPAYVPSPQMPYASQPLYGQPSYSQPTYSQPTYSQPTYSQPVYSAPAVVNPLAPRNAPPAGFRPVSSTTSVGERSYVSQAVATVPVTEIARGGATSVAGPSSWESDCNCGPAVDMISGAGSLQPIPYGAHGMTIHAVPGYRVVGESRVAQAGWQARR